MTANQILKKSFINYKIKFFFTNSKLNNSYRILYFANKGTLFEKDFREIQCYKILNSHSFASYRHPLASSQSGYAIFAFRFS